MKNNLCYFLYFKWW